MKKFTTLKTLLVGLLALGATSASAVEVTETYDFAAFITANGAPALTTTGDAIAQSGTSEKKGSVYLINNLTNNGVTLDLNGRFAVDYASNAGAQIRFMWRSSSNAYQHGLAGNWNNKGTADPQGAARFSILNLKANDKITLTYAKQGNKTADPYTCGTSLTDVAADVALASGKEYTVAADGNVDLYFINNNFAISKIVIKTVGVETVSAPAIKEIGAKDAQRYVSMTSGTSTIGAEVSTYYTLNGDDPTSSSTLYTGPILVDGGVTVKAVSYSTGGTYSEISSLTTDNSGSLSLNAPAINVVNLTEAEGKYTLTIKATSNNASVLGNPTATLSATFDGEDVTEAIVAGTFVPSKDGMLTVTAAADGYTTSNASATLAAYYTRSWQSLDFSSIIGEDAVKEKLGEDWVLSGDHGRWASWVENTYNFYNDTSAESITVNVRISMRNVVVLAEGMGLGRNVTGGEAIKITGTKVGDVVKFEVYNGYGRSIDKGNNTFFSYALNYGTTPALGSTNGALLVQAEIYTPFVESIQATIGTNGYSTFASAYAVEIPSGVTAYTAKVNEAGTAVNFTKIEGTAIPANTGVLLEGTPGDITLTVVESASPLTDNDFIAGTGAAPSDNTKTYFAMVKDSDPLAFGKIAAGVVVPANKAYLAVAAGAFVPESARLTVTFDGEATGIKTVENAKAGKAIYNLNGQRVNKAQKGLYIVNGKKTIVK